LPWLKGQLHLHTTRSDGEQIPAEVVRDYERLGYDFIVFTDHNEIPASEDLKTPTTMVLISGCEYRGAGNVPEIGISGITTKLPQEKGLPDNVDLAAAHGQFLVFNHPNWHIHHWPIEWLFRIAGKGHAVEIYNAAIEELQGPAESTDVWDRLLSSGFRLGAVAGDDAHTYEHRNKAWVMVNAERSEAAILDALRKGHFYASTGVHVSPIEVTNGELIFSSPNAQEIRVYAERNQMRARVVGNRLAYAPRIDDVFVRAEIYGFDKGLIRAWTSPVYVETPESMKRADGFRKWYLNQVNNPKDKLGETYFSL